MKVRYLTILAGFMISILLCGCSSSDELYSDMSESSMSNYYAIQDSAVSDENGNPLNAVYRFYNNLRSFAPYVFIFSIIIGLIGVNVTKKNKGLKRKIIVTFIIGIPAGVVVTVFGYGIACGLFT